MKQKKTNQEISHAKECKSESSPVAETARHKLASSRPVNDEKTTEQSPNDPVVIEPENDPVVIEPEHVQQLRVALCDATMQHWNTENFSWPIAALVGACVVETAFNCFFENSPWLAGELARTGGFLVAILIFISANVRMSHIAECANAACHKTKKPNISTACAHKLHFFIFASTISMIVAAVISSKLEHLAETDTDHLLLSVGIFVLNVSVMISARNYSMCKLNQAKQFLIKLDNYCEGR